MPCVNSATGDSKKKNLKFVRSDAGIAGALCGLRIPGAGKYSFDIEMYNTVHMHTCTKI